MKKMDFTTGKPKVCVSLMAKDYSDLIAQAKELNQSIADIVEWRVDYYPEAKEAEKVIEILIDLRECLADKTLLFTFRTLDEGGEQAIGLNDYKKLYLAVAQSKKVDLMDIELSYAEFLGRQFVQEIKNQEIQVIISHHDFDKTPDDATLIFKIGVMNQFGADVGKLATMPQSLEDVLRMLGLITKARGFSQLPLAVMSMGEVGKISRVSGELIGSVLTFGAVGEASAPGQIPLDQLVECMTALKLS